ncbi:MAG TPA: hypothetical protein VEX17_00755 [Bacillales bacterium]|nr:hypothetical protein [Bacillales bacterium]
MRLITILFVALLACNQQTSTGHTEHKDSIVKIDTTTPVVPRDKPKDTIAPFDDPVYNNYIPQKLHDIMVQKLPGWTLPKPSDWTAYWFNTYKKDSALVNYITADFNCDQKQDYALLLTNKQNEIAVWAIQSNKEDYAAIKLYELGKPGKPFDNGIELIPKGEVNYLDDKGNYKSMNFKCPAIQLLFFEKSAISFYWNNGKYERIQTGD